MKKIILILSAAVAAISFASCNKENDAQSSEQKTITHTFTVNNQLWNGEDVKSSYTAGTGVALSGTELMNVFYTSNGGTTYNGTGEYPIATPDGNGNYTFSHTAITGATNYDYYFVMPYVSTTKLSSGNKGMYVRLSQIQYPKADSFDPNQDYLIAKPVLNNASQQTSIGGVTFKRLFVPFHLTIDDSNNVLNGETVRMVSFVSSQAGAKTNALIGVPYLNMSDNYANTKGSFDSNSVGNGITAVYPSGLSASSKTYSVWYMVAPATLSANSTITVTITTDTKIVSKVITLTSDVTFVSDKINKMTVALPATSTVHKALTWNLQNSTVLTGAAKISNLLPTDGTDVKPWSSTTSKLFTDAASSNLPMGYRMIAGSSSLAFNLDAVKTAAGKNITALRFYIHPNSGNSATTGQVMMTMTPTSGTAQSVSANYYLTTPNTGGVVEFTGLDALSGTLTFSVADKLVILSDVTAVCAD